MHDIAPHTRAVYPHVAMTIPTDLLLPARAGLPADIAYLRGDYPKSDWSAHANYGGLTDFWLQVHASLRDQAEELEQITERFRGAHSDGDAFQRAFVPSFNHFLQHLNGHHQIEDAAYFPKFRMLDPRMVAGFDLLESDHGIIHATLDAMVADARHLLTALSRPSDDRVRAVDRYAATSERLFGLLKRHLADEEDLVIPAMLEHGERSVS